ncbi:MAG TPA: hypothetical protein VFM49_23470 [Chloroflexia bacterium]|jgi:hypothetical protein|nr:hypothetical protein [Chloroflexia bacterium]
MTNAAPTTAPWADSQTLEQVRPSVREILESSDAFRRLNAEEKRALAQTMVTVAAYMVNPDGLAARELSPAGRVLATGQADGVEDTKTRLGGKQGFAGADFQGGAIRQGTQQFGELVKKVNFPQFVSGLIQNVFQAIVDSSIQQMRAYGELLANVAKTVDQFAQDNITENNARDWLAARFPDKLGIDTGDMSQQFAEATTPSTTPAAAPKLVTKGENPAADLKAISDEVQVAQPITDLSDEAQEQRLVLAARLQIARGRQQLLASMVILGINRIVVTDGLIHAKVVFDMQASDQAKRVARASMYDNVEDKAATEMNASYGSWLSPISANMTASASTDHVTTVESSVDETSESKANVKAQLTGEVRVNFKSDYFPMDKLANPQMIAAIQGNAQPPEKPVPRA